MAITLVGYATGGAITNVTYSISLTALTGGSGSAPIAGDVVVLVAGSLQGADTDLTVDSGYIELADLFSPDNWSAGLYVGYKLMGPTPDIEITAINGNSTVSNGGQSGIAYVLRGVDPVNPIDVATTTATGIDSSTPNAPSITPVTPGALVLACGGSVGTAFIIPPTYPASYSNGVYKHAAAEAESMAVIASKIWSSGAEDPAAFGVAQTEGAIYDIYMAWCAATVALRPKPTAGGSSLFFGSNF